VRSNILAICAYVMFVGWTCGSSAAEVPLTIIHTNDLHSHYRPEKGPFNIGGVSRMATILDRIRDQNPNTILLDGGDFSEGHIYYNLGAGRASVQMMNALGYDAIVLGNHDWYNGPRVLGDVIEKMPPEFSFLGANLKIPDGLAADEPHLVRTIKPYDIFVRGGVKIGVIGIVNFELIYDEFVKPAQPDVGFPYVRRYAKELKEEHKVDLVVVLSHNNLAYNQVIAGMRYVDVVVHSHDHDRYSRPIAVERNGKTALMVEAGAWGRFVGKLDLLVDTEKKTWRLKNYDLIQVDATAHDHPTISNLVTTLELELESKYGNIFSDQVIDLGMDLRREGNFGESVITNVMADAYRAYTGADVSFESPKFASGELYSGPVSTADLMNVIAFIYNPVRDRTWTLKTGEMTGRALEEVITYMAFGMQKFEMRGGSISGIRAIYDAGPKTPDRSFGETALSLGALKSLEINGEPVKSNKYYKVALPEGILETITFMHNDSSAKKRFEIRNLEDTGAEQWQVLSWYLQQNAPLNPSKFSRSGRFIAIQPDLALFYEDIQVRRKNHEAAVRVSVRNVGLTDAPAGRRLSVAYEKTPDNFVDDPNMQIVLEEFELPAIAAGAAASLTVNVTLPLEFTEKNVRLYIYMDNTSNDAVHSNNRAWVMSMAQVEKVEKNEEELESVPVAPPAKSKKKIRKKSKR